VLPDVRVPLLALNASDDPVVRKVPVDLSVENPWVTTIVTKGGGHLGWFEVEKSSGELRRWITKPVLEFVEMVALDLEDRKRPRKEIYKSEDGFLKEVGRDDIGCKEIGSGGLVHETEERDLLQGL
jgi:hypothetical protein